MKKLVRKVFDIREGEGFRASLMFIYIFLIIASLLIVKPVRNSLFLTHIGVSKLPYAFVLVAVSAAIIISLYSKYSSRIQLNRMILYATLCAITILLGFYVLLSLDYRAGWFYYALYVWVAIFGVLSASNFWLLANYVFNAREAKRLFGFIGSGAIAGGIFGGYLTNFLAPVVGTRNMILFCVGFASCCIFILTQVWRRWARHNYADRIHRERRTAEHYSRESTLKSVLSSRHLTYTAGIVGVGVIVANLVDYQFNAVASRVITNEDKLTAFFGFWLSNLSIASLCVQLFLTGRILKFFGVMASLFFLPVGILIGAAGILFQPALWSAVFIKVSDGSFKHSIHKAGLELLYVPIPSRVKNRVKSFIDIFIDSAATGIGGMLLIVFTTYLGLQVQYISIIVIGFIAFWTYLIFLVRSEYVNSFRQALEKRSIDLDAQTVNVKDASVVESLVKVLDGRNERQILYGLHLIENVKNEEFIPYFRKLLHSPSAEIKVQLLRILNKYEDVDFSAEVQQLLQDESFEVKVEAMCYTLHHSQNGRDAVFGFLNDTDHEVRSAAFLCIAYEYRDNKEFRESLDVKQLFERFVDHCYQLDHNRDVFNFMKIIIAKVIGIFKVPEMYPFLTNLLHDDSPEVVRAAMSSAGSTRDRRFVPVLIQHLNTNPVRLQAKDALKEYGEDAVDVLAERLENESEDERIRIGISRVLAFIDSQESVDVLSKHFENSDMHIRYEVVKSLNKLKTRFPNLKLDKQFIRSRIIDEAKHYYRIVGFMHQHKAVSKAEGVDQSSDEHVESFQVARNLLIYALEEKLDVYLKLIFRLLGLRYTSKEIYDAYLGVVSKKSDLRANAVEFLDNILDPNLKRLIIPIIEETAPNILIDKTRHIHGFALPTEQESIEFLLHSEDIWLKVCTLYYIAEGKDEGFFEEVERLVNDPNPVVKETAEYCLKKVSAAA